MISLPPLPEAEHIIDGTADDDAYTADDMRSYARQAAEEALEAAAVESMRHTTHPDDPTNEVWQSAYNHVATEISAAIRALKGKP